GAGRRSDTCPETRVRLGGEVTAKVVDFNVAAIVGNQAERAAEGFGMHAGLTRAVVDGGHHAALNVRIGVACRPGHVHCDAIDREVTVGCGTGRNGSAVENRRADLGRYTSTLRDLVDGRGFGNGAVILATFRRRGVVAGQRGTHGNTVDYQIARCQGGRWLRGADGAAVAAAEIAHLQAGVGDIAGGGIELDIGTVRRNQREAAGIGLRARSAAAGQTEYVGVRRGISAQNDIATVFGDQADAVGGVTVVDRAYARLAGFLVDR